MDFPIEDEKLKAASSNLVIYLVYAVRVINWHSWEKARVKDKAKREKVTANFDSMENKVRENFPNADEIINNSFHVFAAKSDLYSIESVAIPSTNPFIFVEEYDEIIGTSAHHACVCFLRRCLRADFWKDNQSVMDRWKSELLPKLNQNQLQLRMYWERMRVFETSDFGVNHNYEGIPTTDQLIEDANSKGEKIKKGFHSPTEDIPSTFSDEKRDSSCRLTGNQAQLAHALGLSEYRFKQKARGKSIWVIQHTPNDLEVLIHKMDRHKVEEYRNRLAEYEPSPPKKKTSRKRKQK
ncbi:hypothetical protein [Gimesia sp.]|uniref:hypothetical protein n=1 Tax=Gimesia sp. TaxID=2024833 RepID=UPI003A93D455